MGLQVWLPLIGTLDNKGLTDVSVTNNGAVIENNGKFGKCYNFGTGSSYLNISKEAMTSFTETTVCFWLKILNWNTSYSTFFQAGKGSYAWNHYIFGFLRNSSNSTCCFTISDGNTASNSSYLTSELELNTWYHIGLTYKTGHCLIYINGNLYHDYSTSIIPNFEEITTITVGTANNGSYQSNCLINDLRIYDEALSPMQIKLISQGLVAHYLLNNSGIPNSPNLLKKQIKETAWSLWGNGDATREKITIDNKVWAHVIQNDTTRYDGFAISPEDNGIIIDHNRQYVISFTAKKGSNQLNSEIIVWWHWRSTEGGANIAQSAIRIDISDDTPHRYSYVIPKYTHATYDVNRINIMMGSYKANNEIYFTDVKFEEGDIATPWIPNGEDAEYTALGLNNNIEYDVSGYCNNGIKYNITDYITDSPRYSLATKFNGTNSYIDIGRGGMVRDEITVNIWAYMDDWTTYNSRLISCTEGGGWNFEPSSSKIHFAIGTGTTSNTYKSPSGYSLANLTSGWHMFTGTYDGFVAKQYVDGVYNTSGSAYTTRTMAFYNANNSILIGAEASGSSGGVTGSYFNGYLSDFRIYATALSESDIQSLYNNSAFIDSSGNVYSTEYVEL